MSQEDPVQSLQDATRINYLHHRFLQSCTSSDYTASYQEGTVNEQQLQSADISVDNSKNGGLQLVYSQVRTCARNLATSINRFGSLLTRSWRQNIRDSRIVLLRLGASVVQAVLFSEIFAGVRDDKSLTRSIADRVALLSFGVISMSIMALMKSLDLFAKERSVVLREQLRDNYSSLEYLLAKVVAEIPLDSLFALIFASVLKRLTGLRSSMMALIKTYCLMTVSSVSLGFAIGSVTSSVESALTLGVPIMVVFMVVGIINPSGVDPNNPPHQLIQLIRMGSPIKWAIEALVTAEFRSMTFDKKDRDR